MKVCFVLEHFYPHVGGVETVFYEYAKRLGKRGCSIRIVCSNSGGVTGQTRLFENVEAFYFPSFSLFGHPLLSHRAVAEHVQWADIVHTTTYTAALPGLRLSKKYGKSCLLTVHEVIGKDWFTVEKNPLKALLFFSFERYVVKKGYRAWHAVSQATGNRLIESGIDPAKIHVIPHGIDTDHWNENCQVSDLAHYFGFPPESRIFLYTGRPGKTKGLLLLLHAIRLVRKKIGKEFRFGLILSDDPLAEKRKLEKIIEHFDLGSLVRIRDAVAATELPGLRKAAYAVLVPSLTEGFGFSAAEACSMNLPVIASDAGSLPEVIGGRSLIFKAGDPADFAKNLLLACEGKFNLRPPKRFDWETATDAMLHLYQKIIAI